LQAMAAPIKRREKGGEREKERKREKRKGEREEEKDNERERERERKGKREEERERERERERKKSETFEILLCQLRGSQSGQTEIAISKMYFLCQIFFSR
jgi:uncharacterized membrane protein YdbT with pleckstrin-like domain